MEDHSLRLPLRQPVLLIKIQAANSKSAFKTWFNAIFGAFFQFSNSSRPDYA